jgi:hypothetical protein
VGVFLGSAALSLLSPGHVVRSYITGKEVSLEPRAVKYITLGHRVVEEPELELCLLSDLHFILIVYSLMTGPPS